MSNKKLNENFSSFRTSIVLQPNHFRLNSHLLFSHYVSMSNAQHIQHRVHPPHSKQKQKMFQKVEELLTFHSHPEFGRTWKKKVFPGHEVRNTEKLNQGVKTFRRQRHHAVDGEKALHINWIFCVPHFVSGEYLFFKSASELIRERVCSVDVTYETALANGDGTIFFFR